MTQAEKAGEVIRGLLIATRAPGDWAIHMYDDGSTLMLRHGATRYEVTVGTVVEAVGASYGESVG